MKQQLSNDINLKIALSASLTTISDKARADEYVYLKNTEELIDSIYGDSRNIYISTYLKYAYKKNKPALSQRFVDFYDKNNELNTGSPIYYDYNVYEPIADENDINPLARNAMRYYTWGVEYTPFSGFNTVVKADGFNEIYSTVKDMQYFKNWITSGNSNGDRNNNYVNAVYSYSGVSSPPQTTITYSTNNISEITLKSEQANETINRIDIWSSENIAWKKKINSETDEKTGTATPIALELWVDSDTKKVKTSEISNAADKLERINDGKLYLDGSDDSSERNLLIKRSELSDTTHGIGIGYEFEEEQPVRAISVYRGRSAITGDTDDVDEAYMDNGLEPIKIYYLEDGGWKKMQPTEFIECAPIPQFRSCTVYPGTNNYKPGYGIWDYDGHHTNKNKDVSTSYLIFNTTINTSKIMVVDSSENSFINVSEMGVYEDDPVQMFDIEGTEFDYSYGYPYLRVVWSVDGNNGDIIFNNMTVSEASIMTNGSIGDNYKFVKDYTDKEASSINIKFKTMAPVSQVIAWKADSENEGVMIPDSSIKVYLGDQSITDSDYFYEMKSLINTTNWSSLNKNMDTLFVDTDNNMILGNPMPYAPLGIDSPRTFAYKMAAQSVARKSLLQYTKDTTIAYQEDHKDSENSNHVSYEKGYASAENLTSSSTEKPFRPGYYLSNKKGGYEDGELSVEQSAGIDSVGLLQGALSMVNQGEFVGADGSGLLSKLDAYYGMNTSNAPGLDGSSLPVFNATETNSYDNIERITAADIERSTIIVPDISEIQEGDLLVSCDDDGTIHTGIVVGFLSDTKPAANANPSVWWNNVLVISVRPGFQTVTLGTWGNNGSIFGGFTENPEDYMIRRVVLKPSAAKETTLTEVDWEAVNSIYYQRYSNYCEEGLVPYVLTKYEKDEHAAYYNFVKADVSTYCEIPPTSYSTNRVYHSVFDSKRMKPTSYTGWRYLEDEEYIGYHRGLDVQPENHVVENYEKGDQTDIGILAPESGKYWLIDLDDSPNDGTSYNYDVYIQIDSQNFLILETFKQENYGDIGVLVTNPDNPVLGRIYLFAHQYATKDGGEGVNEYYSNHSSVHFKDEDGNEKTTMPRSWTEGGFLKAGDWIGLMGGNGGYRPHVHMEVYEFFSDVWEKHSGKVNKLDYEGIVDNIKNNIGVTTKKGIVVHSINWQRVDPRTVFNQNMFVDNDSVANDTEKIIKQLDEHDEYWPDSTVDKEDKYEQFFKPWEKWTRITEEE